MTDIPSKAMTDYRLVTYQTADGARAGEQVYGAAAATRKPQYANVPAILRDWKAADTLLSKTS